MNKIITVIGLPGSGKSSYCKTQAQASHTWYRPEPTDDIAQLRLHLSKAAVSDIILDRFNAIDAVSRTSYRDSDYWTAYYTFGGISQTSGFIAPVSDELHFIYCSRTQQRKNILKRNRPFAQEELQYNRYYWHKKILEAFYKHPAPVKRCFIQGPKPFTWIELKPSQTTYTGETTFHVPTTRFQNSSTL
jgi:hypothetical protein